MILYSDLRILAKIATEDNREPSSDRIATLHDRRTHRLHCSRGQGKKVQSNCGHSVSSTAYYAKCLKDQYFISCAKGVHVNF